LQPPPVLPLLFLERARVSTVFLRRGDTSIECILMFVSLSYTERVGTAWFRARERKRVVLLKEYVRTLCLIERELCVKI